MQEPSEPEAGRPQVYSRVSTQRLADREDATIPSHTGTERLNPSIVTTSVSLSPQGPVRALGRGSELGAFLRSRRARLKPADVGLPPGVRRRTTGLRREEVAQLAGVGTTWYTWLEQGRNINPSVHVIEAVARALRLNPAERRYLFALTRAEEPPPLPSSEIVSDHLRRVIGNLEPLPAYITGATWNVLAWNKTASALFNDFGTRPPQLKNIVWTVFAEPFARTLFVDWQDTARGLLAAVRESSGRRAGDPAFETLISDLQRASPDFRIWWSDYEVGCVDDEPKRLNHPLVGELLLDLATLAVVGDGELRCTIFTPADNGRSLARLRMLAPP